MSDSEWYEIVEANTNLMQGDFIINCPNVSLPENISHIKDLENANAPEVDIAVYDVVILSQSCDLEGKKVDVVLVCPIYPLSKAGEVNQYFNSSEGKEALRLGFLPGYHLLDKCDFSSWTDFVLVDFRNVFGVPYEFLVNYSKSCGKRTRLKSPYREHLSQAFARFFMRVGLPSTIPSFGKKPKSSDIPVNLV